jgi:outer membrane biosynthesis protein TonB
MKIALGTLKDRGEELQAFLEPRVGTKPEVSGDSMEIDDAGAKKGLKARDVKTYIKRFLFKNDLRKNYRIFVEGSELTVQEIELGEEEEKEEREEEKPQKEPSEEAEEPKEKEAEPEEKAEKPKAAKKPRAPRKKKPQGED